MKTLEGRTKAKVIAAKGKIQPIFYNGSIIRIGDKEPVELELKKLLYQPRAQLERALREGDLILKGE